LAPAAKDALKFLFAKAAAPIGQWPPRDALERMLAPLQASIEPAMGAANAAFARALIGDHPYARSVSLADLDRIARADVETWFGRVDNARNGVLVVVGNVEADQVAAIAEERAREWNSPSWLGELSMPPLPPPRPASEAHLVPVISDRAGGLTEVRLGCRLPTMKVADRGHYELLRFAMQERLNAALRFDRGEGYGVAVGTEWLRGGATYLVADTFVDAQDLSETLATIRGHWDRWAREGFDAGELNVARWRYVGALTVDQSMNQAIAAQLFNEWNAEPAALGHDDLNTDVAALKSLRVNELFATCKANGVLDLVGNAAVSRRALAQAWPSLARGSAGAPTSPSP
jgi:predicted Zn-dependent peptidase